MPGRFLTDAERERLTRFPTEVPPEDLVSAFTLSQRTSRRSYCTAVNRITWDSACRFVLCVIWALHQMIS